MIAELP